MIKMSDLPALKARFRTLIKDDLGLARLREDEQGDFLVHYERMSLKLYFHDDDPAYVWLGHFAFLWVKAGDAAAVAHADRCVSETNHRVKAVKLSRRPDPDKDGDCSISASVSFIVDDIASLNAATLERYLGLIKTGSNHFRELFESDAETPAPPHVAVPAMRH